MTVSPGANLTILIQLMSSSWWPDNTLKVSDLSNALRVEFLYSSVSKESPNIDYRSTRLSDRQTTSPYAVTVAVRTQLYNRACSPKCSPWPYILVFPLCSTYTSPSLIMQSRSPGSPSFIMVVPSQKLCTISAEITASFWSSVSISNIGTWSIKDLFSA